MTRYALALGSNRGRPARTIARAIDALAIEDVAIVARSSTVSSPPIGPGTRRYANAVVLIETLLGPPGLLALCKRLEQRFGRRRGRRWGDRTLDIDIVLWTGGCFVGDDVIIPHTAFRERDFVLGPLAHIAPDWRDPVTGLRVRHLAARLHRAKPDAVDRPFARS